MSPISQTSGMGYEMHYVSNPFWLCKSRNAFVTEARSEAREGEMECVQMKKVLLEISRAKLAGGFSIRFN